MIIHELTATFGTLEQHHIRFADGFNILYAPNESGKSTFCQLLVTMLYGLDTRQRDSKTSLADKNRYRPWSGRAMEGLLTCSLNGTRYLLRRSSENGVSMATFSFFYADSNLPVEGVTSDNVGAFLTGVSKHIFTSCCFFTESSLIVNKHEDIEARLLTLLSEDDSSCSYSQAEGTLRQWQHRRSTYKNSELSQIETEMQKHRKTLAQISELREDYLLLQEQITQSQTALSKQIATDEMEHDKEQDFLKEQLEKAKSELGSFEQEHSVDQQSDLQEEVTKANHKKRKARISFYLFAFLSCLAMIVQLIVSYDLIIYPLAISFLCIAIWYLYKIRLHHYEAELYTNLQEKGQTSTQSESLAQERIELYTKQLQQAAPISPEQAKWQETLFSEQTKLAQITGRLQELGDLSELEAELHALQEKKNALEREYEAIAIAMQALKQADTSLHAAFSPALNEKALAYFKELTDHAYGHISFYRDFSATVEPSHSLIQANAHQLSHGTIDQLYFSLRLALCDMLLPENSSVPIILDDALTSFDDIRANRALLILDQMAKRRQVLLFTCQTREQSLLMENQDVHIQNFKEV